MNKLKNVFGECPFYLKYLLYVWKDAKNGKQKITFAHTYTLTLEANARIIYLVNVSSSPFSQTECW